jgi:hypothetical protein
MLSWIRDMFVVVAAAVIAIVKREVTRQNLFTPDNLKTPEIPMTSYSPGKFFEYSLVNFIVRLLNACLRSRAVLEGSWLYTLKSAGSNDLFAAIMVRCDLSLWV